MPAGDGSAGSGMPAATGAPMSRRAYGLALVGLGAALWSTAGLFVRLLPLDVWTLLVWRSLFAALALGLLALAQGGWRPVRAFTLGVPGLIAVPVSAASMMAYVAALGRTTVANVMTVYATIPFVAACLAWAAMGERPTRRILLASGAALLGILVMVGGALAPEDLAGNALALVMTLTFAVALVMARRYADMPLAAVNAAASALCVVVCWPLAGPVPDAGQLALLAVFGATTTGIAYLLFLAGGRHIGSGEAGLIGLLEVVLAPLWVWLAFSEMPGTAALLGGGIVMASVSWYLAGGLRTAAPS